MRPEERARHSREARARLARILSDPGFDVVEAALSVAAEEYPALDVELVLARIDELCAEGARRVVAIANPFERLDGLRSYFFEELGFRGNLDEYDDPRNSYLNDVLDRRLGIPISLSILFMRLAARAGFEPRGIGLPGHFVVRVSDRGRDIFLDPFHGGLVISEEDCRQLVARSTGRPSLFRRELLAGTDSRSMLGRLLLNLKHIHLTSGDYARALEVVERLLLLSPADASEIRDRGFLKAHLGSPGAAIADLERYLALTPEAPDTKSVEGRLSWLRRRLAETN